LTVADPILVTPGQAVGQGDWEALFAQHGGFKSVQNRAPTKEEQTAADDAGIDLVQHPIYRYYLGDGTFVEAQTAPNGADYQVIAYQPSQKFQTEHRAGASDPAAPPGGKPYIDEEGPNGRRLGWNPSTKQYDRDLGSSPSAQAAATAEKKTRVNPNDTTKIQEFNPATGQWTDAGSNDAEIQKRKKDAEDAARLNRPTVRSDDITINGKHFTRVTTTTANGQTTVQNMGPDGKPVEALPDEVKPGTIVKGGGANGEDVQAVADPEHPGQVKYVPIPGAPKPPKVDLPALKMEAGQVSQEVIDRWNELNQKVKNGEITKEQAIKEFEPIHAAAETRLTEIKSVFDQQNSLYSSAQTQRGQDLRDVESRRTAATSAANDAAAYGRTVLGKPGLGKADLAAAEDYVVQRALRAQTSFGGDRQVPQAAPGPALQQANTLNLPGMPTAAGLGDAAPSATGGTVPAPAAPAPAQTPEQAAAARLVNPAFRPAPPTNVTAAPGAAPLPTAAAANPPSGDAQVGNPTSTPVNPPAGEPGNDPSAPVALTPTPAEHHATSDGSPAFTPSPSSGDGSGAPILSLDIPGVGPLKIYSPGPRKDPLQQSADFVGLKTPTAPSVDAPSVSAMGAPESPSGDPDDMLKRLRRIGGDDPSWMQANDALSQQYGGVA
jgi:hypothetical protein